MNSSHDKPPLGPVTEKGSWRPPGPHELRLFVQASQHEGGMSEMPAAAQRFAKRACAAVSGYPGPPELPNWLRAMIQKKASVEDLTRTLHERLHRAPSAQHQELALMMANEIARMQGGPKVLAKYLTPELLQRLGGVTRRDGA